MFSLVIAGTDAGWGDGGKGTVTDYLCAKFQPKYVIKEGGAQGSHGVFTNTGEKFNFSQWGCGSFHGIPTYLSPRMVISPTGLLNESDALKHCGFYDPFAMLSADPSCICATPYHQIWSLIYEMLLRDAPHGTVGTGVGKAYRQAQTNPEFAIRAKDLCQKTILEAKLHAIREDVIARYATVSPSDVLVADIDTLTEQLALLYDDNYFDDILRRLLVIGDKLALVDYDDFIRNGHGTAVVERSHGILTDHEYGFQPHVSELRTLPRFCEGALYDAGYTGRIVNLAIFRAYGVRHGAGPLPTQDDTLFADLPGSHKSENRWQGKVRTGALDFMLLNYALSVHHFDGACLTWFDQILQRGNWPYCEDYPNIHHRLSDFQLRTAKPSIKYLELPDLHDSPQEMFAFCKDFLQQHINVPLRLLSYGARTMDKYFE